MENTITMPQLGETVVEGTIARWLKQVGDRVEEDEPLVEVQTDKVSAEVPSPASGILKEIVAREGDTIEIGKPIAVLSETAPAGTAPAGREERLREKSSPLVRAIAAENNVDVSQVTGTGEAGRVTKSDILTYLEQRPVPPAPAGRSGPGEEEIVTMTPMRKLIAEHMVRSKQASPHVTTIADVDFTEVVALREQYRERILEREGVKITYLPFILKSVAEALKRYPILNSSLVGDQIHIKKYINIGMAVSLEGAGLILPVIKDADKKGLLTLAREIADFAARARANRLKPDEIRGGTFSVTNPGAFGSLMQTPIIHQPQAAILGINKIFKAPAVVNEEITVRSMMYLCLSCDHRIVDSETAVKFLQDIKRSLEEIRFLFT